MDGCPQEITDNSVRSIWHTLSIAAQATMLTAALQQAGGGRQNGPEGAQPTEIQMGMPPPRGNPYPRRDGPEDSRRPGNGSTQSGQRRRRECSESPEGYSGDSESHGDGHRARRTRQSSEPSSDDIPIDPQLANPTQGTQSSRSTHQRSRAGRSTLYMSRGGLAAHWLPRNQLNAVTAAASGATPAAPSLTVPPGVPFYPDPNAFKDDSKPLDIMKPLTQLSDKQVVARKRMGQAVSSAFRDVTSVSEGEKWPKWPQNCRVTAEEDDENDLQPENFDDTERRPVGLRVDFEKKINHTINDIMLTRVSEVAMAALMAKAGIHASWMNAPDVKLTEEVLFACAKKSFSGFRSEFKKQNDAEVAARVKKNARANIWALRRGQKSKQLLKVAPTYMKLHGRNPTPLIIPDHMKDDASGPEDGEDEIEWKRRMAVHANMGERSDVQLEKTSFWENIEPAWRSEELSVIFHELWDLYWKTVTPKQARAMIEQVRGTGRKTNAVPVFAPFNLGIDVNFYNEFKDKDTHMLLLRDWFEYGDPDGFGTSTTPVDGEGGTSPVEEEDESQSGGGSG